MSTRRSFLQTTAAAAALAGAPGILKAQGTPAAGKTLRAVMQGDLRAFDLIWTTASITAYHGAMIYDTLFAMDADFNRSPRLSANGGSPMTSGPTPSSSAMA